MGFKASGSKRCAAGLEAVRLASVCKSSLGGRPGGSCDDQVWSLCHPGEALQLLLQPLELLVCMHLSLVLLTCP